MNDSHVINVPSLIRVRVLLTLPRLQSQARTRRNDKGDDDRCHRDQQDDDDRSTVSTGQLLTLDWVCIVYAWAQFSRFFADKDKKLYRAELFVRDAASIWISSEARG